MSQPPLPEGLQQLLARAAVDRALRDALLSRRAEAAAAAGIALSPSEQAILASVPEAQLAQMIDELARVAPREPPAAYVVDDATRGIRPDLPVAPPAGIRPDMPPPAGNRPDTPIPRGHSAKLPLVLGGAVLVGGAVAVATLTAGIKPDLPPPRAPSAAPSAPDAGREPPASQPATEKPDR